MLDPAGAKTHHRYLVGITATKPIIVLEQIADGSAAGFIARHKSEKLSRVGPRQHDAHLTQPRVGGLIIKTYFPLRLVQVAEALARRQNETVVEHAPDALRRLARPIEFYPTNERFIAKRNEVLVL